MEKLRYHYNCTNPIDSEELNYIIDNGREITRRTFEKHVNKDDLKSLEESLGYDKYFSMKNDWHVSYWKARYMGKDIYYFIHSAIEYVFTLRLLV